MICPSCGTCSCCGARHWGRYCRPTYPYPWYVRPQPWIQWPVSCPPVVNVAAGVAQARAVLA